MPAKSTTESVIVPGPTELAKAAFAKACEQIAATEFGSWIVADEKVRAASATEFAAAYKVCAEFAGEHDENMPEDEEFSGLLIELRTEFRIDEYETALAALNDRFDRSIMPKSVREAFAVYSRLAKGFDGIPTINKVSGTIREKSKRGR